MWQASTCPYPIHTIHKSTGRIPYSERFLVLGFVGCGVLAVVRHSVRTRKQPTTTHTEFSWTRVFLDPPLASRHFGDGDVRFTVHHRRTLL